MHAKQLIRCIQGSSTILRRTRKANSCTLKKLLGLPRVPCVGLHTSPFQRSIFKQEMSEAYRAQWDKKSRFFIRMLYPQNDVSAQDIYAFMKGVDIVGEEKGIHLSFNDALMEVPDAKNLQKALLKNNEVFQVAADVKPVKPFIMWSWINQFTHPHKDNYAVELRHATSAENEYLNDENIRNELLKDISIAPGDEGIKMYLTHAVVQLKDEAEVEKVISLVNSSSNKLIARRQKPYIIVKNMDKILVSNIPDSCEEEDLLKHLDLDISGMQKIKNGSTIMTIKSVNVESLQKVRDQKFTVLNGNVIKVNPLVAEKLYVDCLGQGALLEKPDLFYKPYSKMHSTSVLLHGNLNMTLEDIKDFFYDVDISESPNNIIIRTNDDSKTACVVLKNWANVQKALMKNGDPLCEGFGIVQKYRRFYMSSFQVRFLMNNLIPTSFTLQDIWRFLKGIDVYSVDYLGYNKVSVTVHDTENWLKIYKRCGDEKYIHGREVKLEKTSPVYIKDNCELLLKGLPRHCSMIDIRIFFAGFTISSRQNCMTFFRNANGYARIRFQTENIAMAAKQAKNFQQFGDSDRYINIYSAGEYD